MVGAFGDDTRGGVDTGSATGRAADNPFPLYPTDLTAPPAGLLGAEAVHRVLRGWLAELGQPADADGAEVVTRGSAGNVGGLAHHDAEHVGDGGQAGHLQVRGRDR